MGYNEVGGTFQISWMLLQELAGACPKSPWAVPRVVWAHWLGAGTCGKRLREVPTDVWANWLGALMCSQGAVGLIQVYYSSLWRLGYIPDLLDALTGASWGLPQKFLVSGQGCVGPLVRETDVLPGSCRVPLSLL